MIRLIYLCFLFIVLSGFVKTVTLKAMRTLRGGWNETQE